MTKNQAAQLRRAIAKCVTARDDLAYAIAHEPHNADKAHDHLYRCKRRLELLIDRLTDKDA